MSTNYFLSALRFIVWIYYKSRLTLLADVVRIHIILQACTIYFLGALSLISWISHKSWL